MAEAMPPNNANYIQKADIIEVLQKHIINFRWRGEQIVLDINCGLGEVTRTVLFPHLPEHATLIGWDQSKEMVDYCNKYRKEKRLSFNEINIQYVDLFFNWKWDSFHKIFSFYCIRWMQSFRRSLRNMHSLLKSNGDMLLIVLTPDNPMHRAFERLKERPSWRRLLLNITWFYNASEPVGFIRRLLEEIGFTNIYCYPKTGSSTYPSWDAYMELINAVNPYLVDLPEHQITEGLKYIKEYLKHDEQVTENTSTGEITVGYGLVVVLAKKEATEETSEKK